MQMALYIMLIQFIRTIRMSKCFKWSKRKLQMKRQNTLFSQIISINDNTENSEGYINFDDNKDDYNMRFNNVARLYNDPGYVVLERLRESCVVIVGLGGVGSWVVEALARSGIGYFYLIDMDDICISNVNRQLPALSSTVGKFKGEVLKDRILDINPTANVTFLPDFLRPNNLIQVFSSMRPVNYVIDCADGVTDKAAIVDYCVKRSIPIAVSGGAGGMTDPTLIRISDMSRSLGDTLIMRVRKKLRQDYGYPEGKHANKGLKIDKKWNILVAHSLPTGVVRQSKESKITNPSKITTLRKCDAIYGNTCFSTGSIGFALASIAVNAIATGDYIIPKRLGFKMKNNMTTLENTGISTLMTGISDDTEQLTNSTSDMTQLSCGRGTTIDDTTLKQDSNIKLITHNSAKVDEIDTYFHTKTIQYFDSHCHLQLHPSFNRDNIIDSLTPLLQRAFHSGIKGISICGVTPLDNDWKKVEEISNTFPQIIPNYGLHPWWIKRYYEQNNIQLNIMNDFEILLCQLLEKYNHAGVGECGLDKGIRRDISDIVQEDILKRHIAIASRYQRSLTIHCVGMWTQLLDILKNTCITADTSPRCIILHSCNSMPSDMVQSFTSSIPTDIFFSLSAGRYENPKFFKLIKKIPLSNFLLETDSPDQCPSLLRIPGQIISNEPSYLRYECYQLSQILGVAPEELASITLDNAYRAYKITSDSTV